MKRWAPVLIVLCLPDTVPAAEPIGRLFYTPAQRAQLDTARAQRSRANLGNESTEPQTVPEVVTLDGAVQRSDGKSTIWINNRPYADGDRRGAVAITRRNPDGSVTLTTPQAEKGVRLKVGQSVEILSGRIEEPYARSDRREQPPGPSAKPPPAVVAKKPPATMSKADRDKEDRQRQLEDAVRALQEAAAANPGAIPAPQPAGTPVPAGPAAR